MTQLLFSDFAPANKESWISQAIKDLKGKDFDSSLKSSLWDEIEIAPFYTQEDALVGKEIPANSFENSPEIGGFPSRNWVNYFKVSAQKSNKQVLNALENGANGLILCLQGQEDLKQLLQEVRPEYISILIKPQGDPTAAMDTFLTWVRAIGVDESRLNGGLLWSPMDMLFEEGKSLVEATQKLNSILDLCPKSSNFYGFHFNFTRYAEAGASGLDELILGFGEMIDLLDQSGIDPNRLFGKGAFFTAVGDLHFPEIAKLKALRLFATTLALQYDIELKPQDISIFAKTSAWSKSTIDANTNLIRQTYEAMAAVLGGANALWVAPLQDEKASELELRIARNVSSILVHESYLDKVADPAAGSYYLDFLIDQLREKTKAGLQKLEEKGGWYQNFELGHIHQQIRESREKQQNQVLLGEIAKIGVNKYPASNSLKNDLDFLPVEEKSKQLNPSRSSFLVELKNQTEA
ncbi:methylmalonyl-CoA mutase family protein [Algoriphagus litoralis]|uniref:methylmalonyl-CoA mutase family protein n=1 Tax=Algoriphagus litoralis TaxID=2202829 RepID=UPI000DB93D70|nr:methylmalonyl-CoA mutase family protein [Algoriphagus litoralis]